jgi:sulfocyanin
MVWSRVRGAGLVMAAWGAMALLAACGGSGSPSSSSSSSSSSTSSGGQASSSGSSSTVSKYLTSDASTKTVDLTLVAGATNALGGFNFDGYGNGKLTVTVPEGWKVVVTCTNRQSVPHSCAIVSGAASTTPAFSGASTPDPTTGLPQGQSASFTFTPDQTGTYRIACLVPGHEDAGMWDTLVVASGGSPSITTS